MRHAGVTQHAKERLHQRYTAPFGAAQIGYALAEAIKHKTATWEKRLSCSKSVVRFECQGVMLRAVYSRLHKKIITILPDKGRATA